MEHGAGSEEYKNEIKKVVKGRNNTKVVPLN
jgi:hypothetical protein